MSMLSNSSSLILSCFGNGEVMLFYIQHQEHKERDQEHYQICAVKKLCNRYYYYDYCRDKCPEAR